MCYPACWSEVVALSKDSRLQNDNTVALSLNRIPPAVGSKQLKNAGIGHAKTVLTPIKKFLGHLAPATNSSMHYGSLPGHSYVVR